LGYRAGACGSAEDDDGWQDSEQSKANADNRTGIRRRF
jgi:hypothetical protein